MNQKLWAGRFTKQTHPDVEQYTASINFDHELAYEDILGSLAHATMLAHCGLINADENNQIQRGLKRIAKKMTENKMTFSVHDEDIHMNIERRLSEDIGEIAGKLHSARSRNDQVALDMHLFLRKQIVFIVDLLIQLQSILVQMAKKHCHIILPGYTHLQRAQPIYLAQHWLAYVSMLQRDVERLQNSWTRINKSPLGACALTGTTFPTDQHYVATLLGFEDVYSNSLDAVSDRDFVIEFLSASALIMMHISRLSEELILWSSQEFNFIYFDDAFCTGSSIMPQKKNPDIAELGRGKTGRVYGALFSLLTVLKGLPLAYNKDLQEDKEPVFDVVKTLRQTLAIFTPMLATLKINSKNMRQAVEVGYLNATALAEYLVKNGLTFRAAHETVGKMVAFCIDKKCRLEDLSLQEMQNFCSAISNNVYQFLSIEKIVADCNKSYQSPLSLLDIEFTVHEQHLKTSQAWFLAKHELLATVYAKFDIPLSTICSLGEGLRMGL